jgi:NAD(P)-dependent dehydrogenase (short-subunit alcohol dehydrogenase family)
MQGRTIVVTGAGGALGSVVAALAGERGATIAMIDVAAIAPERGAQGAQHLRLGGLDLTDAAAVQAAMDDIKARTGRLDALVNIAGGFTWQTLADGDLDGWDAMYRINVKTAATACKAALPHLIASGAGRIVNVSALGSVKAAAGMGPYAASKAGVAKLTESLAEELKGAVTVNAVLPSIIDTPANRKDMPDTDYSKWVTPGELASVILFLVSDEASAVTGALIPVPGRV